MKFSILIKRFFCFRLAFVFCVAFFSGLLLVSCKRSGSGLKQEYIARVNNDYLYLSDVAKVLPANISSRDSAVIVDRFIKSWVSKQVFLQEARNNLTTDKQNFERQIEEYRNSLLVFAYENQLIKEQLDTLITESQLADYYGKNQADFRLQVDIVKADYVKLPLDVPEQNRFRRLFRSKDPDEFGLLEEYCMQNAASFFIGSDSWLIFADLLREVPLKVSNSESFLRANQSVEVSDENFRYFVNILDHQLQGSVSPLTFEKENIRSILLNQRKQELINRLRNQIYQAAVDRGQVEILR